MTAPVATVAERIVVRLLEAGVQTLFGMPGGGSNLDLVDAAGRAGLPFVLAHTETAGALAACAQAELTGRPGACLATLGPGVSSIVNGVAHARLDRVPLMVLTDSLAAEARDTYQHQRLDHGALLSSVTKASYTLVSERADQQFAEALAIAADSPPGPVHVDLDPAVAKKTVSGVSGRVSGKPRVPDPAPRTPDPGHLKPLFANARRPILIAGLGVRDGCDAEAVRRLCERHGIPALVTYKAKGVIPDEHPLFAGVFTLGAVERPLVEQADLIIGAGLDPIEFLPRPWGYRMPVVAVSRWPLEQRHMDLAASLVGDLPGLLGGLGEWLPARTGWHLDEIRAHATRQRTAVQVPSSGWAPWRAVAAAARAAGPDTPVTVDAGAHMFPITALWPARRPRQVLISNGLSTMGFALPAGLGAALIDRTRRVLVLTGDGGLLMCLAELRTLARERLKVTVVVFNDQLLSLIAIKQERLGIKPAGVSIEGIDWQAAAAAFGVPAWRATGDAEMTRCLAEADATGGPALVEAVVDPAGYAATLQAVRG